VEPLEIAAVLLPPYGLASAIAVSALVGTVKFPVYTARPLTQRKFVMYPTKAARVEAVFSLPIVSSSTVLLILLVSVI
jgi:hypothetical protein